MSSKNRKETFEELLRQESARFFNEVSNKTSLITVTRAELSDTQRVAKVFITVFPEDKESEASDFAKRQQYNLKQFLTGRIKSRQMPNIEVLIDKGEKHRQRLDELRTE